jgi:putative endopeptidase
MRFLLPIFLLSCLSFPSFAQTTSQDSSKPAPQLDHFDPKKVDSSVDPCTDFYQYSCNRWIADNPVPPDEIFWDSFGKLQLWNETFLHQTVLEVAAKPANERTPVEQKVGDYWAACTDQKQQKCERLLHLAASVGADRRHAQQDRHG